MLARETTDPAFAPEGASAADAVDWANKAEERLQKAFETLAQIKNWGRPADRERAQKLLAERDNLNAAVRSLAKYGTGTLKIRVVEGFVDKVYVENDRPASDRRHLIEGYAHKINQMRPLNTKTLERYMLLISDLPGVTARAIIRPSPSTFGAADLVIKVTNKVFEGSFTSDNRGNKFIGPRWHRQRHCT